MVQTRQRLFWSEEKFIYICFVYHSPRNSTFSNNCNEDMFETVSSRLNKYSSDGDILLCGDFKARTGFHNSDL